MSIQQNPKTIYLKDYQTPPYKVGKVKLQFELDPDCTVVQSVVTYTHSSGHPRELRLDGNELTLTEVRIDGELIDLATLDYSSEYLVLSDLPESFTLQLTTHISPRQNTALEGLYLSHEKFCTQCEAEGFRRITYYLDRPDVMAEFETTIIGYKSVVPVMLSNGNLVSQGTKPDGKHFTVWHDPFPKPAYLFALVAGQLSRITDTFTTRSGRKVDLHIYVEPLNLKKCHFAMQAIKHAMRWDEEVYGLEYDLDLFMVVAVSDFNMGAMENKGLNIFNSKYVLASPETATDTDFEGILSVVGHEYFHNWTGNRVTLRDWFQLSLKEGWTVFRDQEFSATHGSAAVKRIQDVSTLREHQFLEDAGPMAHPVRPDQYIEINNFYTATVYRKGAEVIRMLHTLIGTEAFQRGSQIFFQRFDGMAVTIEDLLAVMQEASGQDLSQFKLWYEQAGTPEVKMQSCYSPGSKTLHLKFDQSLALTGEGSKAFLMPVRLGLVAKSGTNLTFRYQGKEAAEHTLLFSEKSQEFVLEGVSEDAIASSFRNFSAPVKLSYDMSKSDRLTLMTHDSDPFNRFEAIQIGAKEWIFDRAGSAKGGDPLFLTALEGLLKNKDLDPSFVALCLQIPSTDLLLQDKPGSDLDALFQARQNLHLELASQHRDLLLSVYRENQEADNFQISNSAIGKRALKNICLYYLGQLDTQDLISLCLEQFQKSQNMTDRVGALSAMAHSSRPERDQAFQAFYLDWRHDQLVIDKWFALQSGSAHPEVLTHVQQLLKHPDFDLFNPNRIFSIFRHFTQAFPLGFHHSSGEGYSIVAKYVLSIDGRNPQVAARLARFLSRYKQFDPKRKAMMQKVLQSIANTSGLSPDVYEVVSKSLA